ncbi:MAG: DUF1501 domain-containing protein [Fuerstiella sp.]|nr:DUF1501 domain-containing protein [Fuerstiella sp.]
MMPPAIMAVVSVPAVFLSAASMYSVNGADTAPELKHVLHLSNRILCGSEPRGPSAFETLKKLEVKTIVSVDAFDKRFRDKFNVRKVKTYTDLYSEATSLLASDELKAFDLNEEEAADRDRYGRDSFGQGCLLARRLIENNMRCVEVTCGGWDMHNSIYNAGTLPSRANILDKAVGNLIKDLDERGLLAETLIVLTTEFGRSPVINYNVGRDHHPAVFSAALAGGGIKGGQLYGKSDAEGHNVDENGVSPADLNATIAMALGLPLKEVIKSPTGRPFTVAHDGNPIAALL